MHGTPPRRRYFAPAPFHLLDYRGYGAILADPPWHFKTYNDKGRLKSPDWRPFKGAPERHYKTMSLDDIKALPVGDLAAPDCALFLWGCWATLGQTMEVVDAWGFEFKTCAFVWTKTGRMGLGYWTRQSTEFCLLAVRGHPRRLAKNIRQELILPRRKHSQKPHEIYGKVEGLVGGPYVELFARNYRAGWTSWGNEVSTARSVLALGDRPRS